MPSEKYQNIGCLSTRTEMVAKEFIISPIFCLILLCVAVEARPQEILIVQSMRIKPYAEAVEGFKGALNARFREARYTVRGSAEAASYLRERRPDLILAVGMEALQKVKRFSHVPIVYLMVLNPSAVLGDAGNITGVGMTIAPEKQLTLLQKVLPGARHVGIIYDPRKSAPFLRRAQNAARGLRIELLAREVGHPREVPEALKSLKGVADALWMIPDTSVVTPETTELMMLFSLDNSIPVCAFSAKYLDMGALMSLDVSASDMGRQAGGLAARILSGAEVSDVSAVEAENPSLFVNGAVARKLRLSLGEEVRGKTRIAN